MKYLILYFLILLSLKAFSIVGHDDRFYIHGTKWAKLLNGIVQFENSIATCTAFVIEGDIIVSAAHCFFDWVKSGKIDYKQFQKDPYFFYGDMNADPLYDEDTHFNQRFPLPKIKDLFLAYDPSIEHKLSTENAVELRDYAFIKLKKPIPKHIKRFKIFHPDLLKDYEILKHPYKGNLSIAGYHGDNHKTVLQRMAHIGCKVRDRTQYRKMWLEYSDCDTFPGVSGAPFFYILRHKKTKKIELAVKNILVLNRIAGLYKRETDKENTDEKGSNPPYRLGLGAYYYRSPVGLISSIKGNLSGGMLITNHKEFLSNLEKFKKDSSFFRNKKIPEVEKSKYLNKNWIYKNIIQKKSLKELKEFLVKKDLFILSKENESGIWDALGTLGVFTDIVHDSKFKMHASKREFLKIKFPKPHLKPTKDAYFMTVIEKYPDFRSERGKKISDQKNSYHLRSPRPFEDSVNDKEKAKKLWKMYFLNDQKKDKLSNDQEKAKKLKELYFFK